MLTTKCPVDRGGRCHVIYDSSAQMSDEFLATACMSAAVKYNHVVEAGDQDPGKVTQN